MVKGVGTTTAGADQSGVWDLQSAKESIPPPFQRLQLSCSVWLVIKVATLVVI
jgi:hypothetical protein